MLSEANVIGFIPVTDFDVAESFYCSLLGLRVESRDEFALVVRAAGGVRIRCVKAGKFTPQPFTIFGWEVADLPAMAERMIAAGIEPLRFSWFEQEKRGIWTAPDGTGVFWFHDPFGNTLSLSRHASVAAG